MKLRPFFFHVVRLVSAFSFLYVWTASAGCKNKSLDNACNPESKSYWESVFVSLGSGNTIPYCAGNPDAPRNLTYSTPTIVGNGLPFSITPSVIGSGLRYSVFPSLPAGATIDALTGVLSGSYIGFAGSDTVYTVTAVNSSGFVSASVELVFLGPLPLKTGQTTCFDPAGNPIGCTGTGQDGQLQNGSIRSFTGPTLVSGTDYTTTDNRTGLVWKSCAEGQAGATCVGAPNSTDWATGSAACANLNTISYANRTDWRLPTVQELGSILLYDGTNPATFAAFFPNTSGVGHWTSTPVAGAPGDYWYDSFTEGVNGKSGPVGPNPSRCVGGPTLPTPLFRDNGDSTVTDVNTGLVWVKCPAGLSGAGCTTGAATVTDWQNALLACNSLNQSGRVWRLPSINELRSIADLTGTFPISAINSTYFPNTPAGIFWTSSTGTVPANAWIVDFGAGNLVVDQGKGAGGSIRCVATGP
ncbi:DUF1566 domain-containing protein [Leptospira gomenensis]|uniref:DUF1566 domain-containing protein n=1 Tax=Leptospira gomenensis TaxID=2484974 RepID=A0A5F1Y986_9LEPT|nr:DUF1566 domain-containing protein [Leptospira gomenensis]TGK32672.1 DUF1566 domain-containing protein [Leptospira gomenensis]TGK36820.1 DUF1566 domain-containing protein [Leptospira gomenensis]TGK39895.1 DUF1566 domain-containing protein [Leptospira gomenensis]TGK58030.1 DUF1566 domain-containing protein [Leptospira gomenensis]